MLPFISLLICKQVLRFLGTSSLAVSSFLPCVFKLLLRIVENGSTLSNKF